MFSNRNNVQNLPSKVNHSGDIPSIIAADLKIVGNLICGGSLEIEGEIEGNVTCGHVTIRRSGAIKGDVVADEVHVDGEISGLVKGKNVTISESGRVTGFIMYESLSVKDGAFIDGQCKSADRVHKGEVEAFDAVDNLQVEKLKQEFGLVKEAAKKVTLVNEVKKTRKNKIDEYTG